MSKGKVYLIGAGPDGKDLITLKGLEALRQADVVVYDYLVDEELLEETKPGAQLVCSDKLGKYRKKATATNAQDRINALIISLANKGKNVIRLKNGDPFIFGRASEEIEALRKNQVEFEVVPGITAAQAAAAYSGMPLTDRECSSSVVFVTGQEANGKDSTAIDWKNIAANSTIVLYMAVKNISRVAQELIQAGKPAFTPTAAISNAGRINQKTVVDRLDGISEAIKKEHLVAPAVFVIGRIVAFEKQFNWFKKNKRVLFTGLSDKRFFLKGTYFHLPMIRIIPLSDYAEFDSHIKNIHCFDWVVFTSRYGAQYFFERLNRLKLDARILHSIKIAAIGVSTAMRLEGFGRRADLIPQEESSRGLLAAFRKISLRNKNIFLPRSDISDKGLNRGLENLGAKVTACVAYKNVMPEHLPDIDISSFDEIMFTSPSGVRNFLKRYCKPPEDVQIKCIGEVTRAEAKRLKFL